MSKITIVEEGSTPSPPSAGSLLVYPKTDNNLYIQNSSGVESQLSTGSPGTVTTVSVVTANGLAGSVANPTTTPAITLSTTISGVLKGNGTAISAAVAGTDYVIPSGSITGSSGSFTGSLSGDVTGTQSATVVATVGTSSAANIHTAELAANAATASNTPNTIVKRNGSGNAAVSDPVAGSDIATKSYVDNIVANDGIAKAAVTYATTTVLPTNVYNNGASGVGATLTGVALAALSIDGNTVSTGQRVLIKNEGTAANNGIYTVTTVGSGIAAYVLTRATDFDQSAEIMQGDSVFVISGATLASTTWVMSSATPLTVGTSAINWVQTAGPGSITIGSFNNTSTPNALDLTGTVLTAHAADATNPGNVSTGTQSFAGNKTFTGTVAVSPSSTSAVTINTSAFIFDSTNNALGIGVQPATNAFIDAVNSTGATKRIMMTGYGASSFVGTRDRFARGTSGTPAAAQNGDILGFMSGQGYGTSQFPATSTGAFNFVAGETFTNTSNLTYATVQVTPTGSTTAAEAFRVASTGLTLGPQSSSTAVHQINGGVNYTTKTITAATYTVDTTTTDYIIYSDSTANAIAITLPAPTNGRYLMIQDKSGQAATNNVTIKQHAAETISGLTQQVIAANYGGMILTSDGTNWNVDKIPTSGFSFLTAGTTYTTPVNITPQTRFKFTVVGGGGGGAGSNTANLRGAGGGAGGTCIAFLTGLAASTGYTMAIGAAGAGGISSTTAATAGGDTTITINATTYTGSGGNVAANNTASTNGGLGGAATNGTINIAGQRGGGNGATSAAGVSGPGGSTSYGAGGAATGLTAGSGQSATGFGAGGGGSVGTATTGGAGSAGMILVEWEN